MSLAHLKIRLEQLHALNSTVNQSIRKEYPVGAAVEIDDGAFGLRGKIVGYENRWRVDLKVQLTDGRIITKVISIYSIDSIRIIP